jgi:hypothetical protein
MTIKNGRQSEIDFSHKHRARPGSPATLVILSVPKDAVFCLGCLLLGWGNGAPMAWELETTTDMGMRWATQPTDLDASLTFSS